MAHGYDALMTCLAVGIAGGTWVSARWRRGLAERVGRYPPELAQRLAGRPVIWLHAASVGELQGLRAILGPLRDRFPGARWKIHRVYNGIDLAPWEEAGASAARVEPPLIVSVGRLIEKKGFDDLIEACAGLRDREVSFQCRIIGDGPLEAELQSLIEVSLRRFTVRRDLPGQRSRRFRKEIDRLVKARRVTCLGAGDSKAHC